MIYRSKREMYSYLLGLLDINDQYRTILSEKDSIRNAIEATDEANQKISAVAEI